MGNLRLEESQLGKVISLARTIHAPAVDTQLRWQRAVDELCNLIGAAGGASALLSLGTPTPQVQSALYVGRSKSARQLVQQWLDNPPIEETAERMIQMLRAGTTALARSRRQLLPDNEKRSPPPTSTEIRNDCIYSFMLLSESTAALLCLTGPRGRKTFSNSDARLVQLIHSEMQPLYLIPSEPRAAEMTPRQRQIHQYLLKGHGEKQIAASEGLSRHTVHAHVKAIYKHFHVTSRPELLARFVRE
jgi:DNA-binding CsgD family transcriptional regulator